MKLINILSIPILSIIFLNCSGSKDLSGLAPEEMFLLAKQKYEKKNYVDAITEFESIAIQHSGSAVMDDVQYYLGLCYYGKKEFIRSAFEFSKLIKNYPTSEFVVDAQFMLAESYYQLSPHRSLDQRYTESAIEEYQAFIDFFPEDPRVSEAERKIRELTDKLARKIYETAERYRRMGYTRSALIYYDQLLEKYSDSKYSSSALYNKIKILASKNRKSEAIDEANKYLQLFPQGEYSNEIRKLLGELTKSSS